MQSAESLKHEKAQAVTVAQRRALLDGLLALHDVPAPESMIESDSPSLVRDFVDVMYCVDVPDLPRTVTFETIVRSSAVRTGASSRRAAARARTGRANRLMKTSIYFEDAEAITAPREAPFRPAARRGTAFRRGHPSAPRSSRKASGS